MLASEKQKWRCFS